MLLVFNDQFFDLVEFVCGKSVAAREAHRIKPELGLTVVPFDMNMWRLVSIASVEEQSVRAASEYRGRLSMLR